MGINESELKLVLRAIATEARSAAENHPPMHSHHEAYAVIKEEFDEYWAEVMTNPKKGYLLNATQARLAGVAVGFLQVCTPEDARICRLAHKDHLRLELIQTAAMCVRALVDLA